MSKKRQRPSRGRLDDPDARIAIRTLAMGYAHGHVLDAHRHDGWAQLIYASRGVMSVHTEQGSWVVPSHRAVWVPASVEHRIEMAGEVSMRTVYVASRLARSLPRACRVVGVPALLRELILHACAVGHLDRSVPRSRRLAQVILDRIGEVPTVPLELPMPTDARAVEVARVLLSEPSDASPVDALSPGTSKRTLERLFLRETGMTFGRWRQQLRLLHAIRRLATGASVTTVALDTGYEGPSAFIAMFKRALGTTPGRYALGR